MSFSLVGFRQMRSVRKYFFRSPQAAGGGAETFTVDADLDLFRKHRIPLQELPLLCLRLLEAASGKDKSRALTFGEEDVLVHVQNRAQSRLEAELRGRKRTALAYGKIKTSGPPPKTL